ncbi:hypothetical protein EVAR_53766_1 [Eumeta japonica]|uniref:Uncharacterized protein n=1 Tax=Eumeta variegata TaxID=151549 RepID=A0A4C1Z1T8_EUMVA|nr:hypothetical protein EVAR_53766_1 [Eumeta japonica]
MLLHDIREPISFADLKTIDDYLRTTGTAHFALQLPFNIAEEQFPYANKESDMAVFQTAKDNDQQNSEILVYQMGRYIDSDEAAWRSFGFPIQEREPFVQHLALHLKMDREYTSQRYRHKDWK